MVTLVGRPSQYTFKRAEEYLLENGIQYTKRDINNTPPTFAELTDWVAKSGQFVSSFVFYSVAFKAYNTPIKLFCMNSDLCITALSKDQEILTSPILITDDKAVAKFDRNAWDNALLDERVIAYREQRHLPIYNHNQRHSHVEKEPKPDRKESRKENKQPIVVSYSNVVLYGDGNSYAFKMAQLFLDNNKIPYKIHNTNIVPITRDILKKWVDEYTLPAYKYINAYNYFHTVRKYRNEKDDTCIDMLTKRSKYLYNPILVTDNDILLGFRNSMWMRALNISNNKQTNEWH